MTELGSQGVGNRSHRCPEPSDGKHMSRILVICLTASLFCIHAPAQVTFERLVNSAKEPQNWMTYSGDYSGKRFSRLDQMLVDKKMIGHRCRVFASGRPVRISTKFKSNQTCPPNQTAHEQVSGIRSFDGISLRGHEFVKFLRQSCYRQLWTWMCSAPIGYCGSRSQHITDMS